MPKTYFAYSQSCGYMPEAYFAYSQSCGYMPETYFAYSQSCEYISKAKPIEMRYKYNLRNISN